MFVPTDVVFRTYFEGPLVDWKSHRWPGRHLGWGLLNQYSPFRYFPNFSE